MDKRITIKDIAKELNIHHSTVSRALRNDTRVNDKTRDTVLDYAREHNYQANMNAIQLRGTKNNAIALIVPNINHSFFSDIISLLSNFAYQKGFVISVFQSNENYELEKEIVNTIIQHNFAGVIVSIAQNTTNSDHFALLKKFGIPLVFFDRVCEELSTPMVLINNYDVTFEATEYLISKGYKKIVHITGTETINVFRNRQNGYIKALEKHDIEYINAINITDDFSVPVGKEMLSSLWNSDNRPDAIISSSIHLTMGILLEARKLDIHVPTNLGIITFGTLLTAEILQPAITSIEQPEKEIAEVAFNLLLKLMNKEIKIDSNIIEEVKAKIKFKESC